MADKYQISIGIDVKDQQALEQIKKFTDTLQQSLKGVDFNVGANQSKIFSGLSDSFQKEINVIKGLKEKLNTDFSKGLIDEGVFRGALKGLDQFTAGTEKKIDDYTTKLETKLNRARLLTASTLARAASLPEGAAKDEFLARAAGYNQAGVSAQSELDRLNATKSVNPNQPGPGTQRGGIGLSMNGMGLMQGIGSFLTTGSTDGLMMALRAFGPIGMGAAGLAGGAFMADKFMQMRYNAYGSAAQMESSYLTGGNLGINPSALTRMSIRTNPTGAYGEYVNGNWGLTNSIKTLWNWARTGDVQAAEDATKASLLQDQMAAYGKYTQKGYEAAVSAADVNYNAEKMFGGDTVANLVKAASLRSVPMSRLGPAIDRMKTYLGRLPDVGGRDDKFIQAQYQYNLSDEYMKQMARQAGYGGDLNAAYANNIGALGAYGLGTAATSEATNIISEAAGKAESRFGPEMATSITSQFGAGFQNITNASNGANGFVPSVVGSLSAQVTQSNRAALSTPGNISNLVGMANLAQLGVTDPFVRERLLKQGMTPQTFEEIANLTGKTTEEVQNSVIAGQKSAEQGALNQFRSKNLIGEAKYVKKMYGKALKDVSLDDIEYGILKGGGNYQLSAAFAMDKTSQMLTAQGKTADAEQLKKEADKMRTAGIAETTKGKIDETEARTIGAAMADALAGRTLSVRIDEAGKAAVHDVAQAAKKKAEDAAAVKERAVNRALQEEMLRK